MPFLNSTPMTAAD